MKDMDTDDTRIPGDSTRGAGNVLVSLGTAILIFGLFSGVVRFWDTNGEVLLPSFRYAAFVGVPLFLTGLFAGGRSVFGAFPLLHPSAFIAALGVSFWTDWLCRDYSLLQGPGIRGPIIIFAGLSFLLLAQRSVIFLRASAVLAPLLLLASFISVSEGRLLYSDDHPSMLHRLQMLKEHFPAIPFYNPTWNAGFDNRDFFATGVLGIFAIFAPLIYSSDLVTSYTFIIGILIFIAVPALTYLAAKTGELADPVPSIASLVSLCTSLLWYRWSLQYGAIGFFMSASLVPLNLMLFSRLLSSSREFSFRCGLLLIVSLTLMLFWSLSAIVFLPVFLLVLFYSRRVLSKPGVKGIALAILAVNIPWMLVFLSVSSVGQFLSLSRPAAQAKVSVAEDKDPHALSRTVVRGGAKKFSPGKAVSHMRDSSSKMNPLVLFLALPGFLMFTKRSIRTVYGVTALWLLIPGIGGPFLKPQLELDRMLVILGLISAIPTAQVIAWAVNEGRLPGASVACGYLFAGLFSVSGVAHDRSPVQFVFAEDLVWELSDAIRANGGDGRTLFSGFMLHDLGSGHLLPLTMFSGKPLIASSPFHNVWWYTDVIPPSYGRRKAEGIEEFLDLYNVTAVISRERKWRAYFDRDPAKYMPVFRKNGFSLYRRQYESSYFVKGSGSVLEQGTDYVKVRVDSPSAVIKFNYFPFLQTDRCSILSEDISDSIHFIRLENCEPGSTVTIKAGSAFSRLPVPLFEKGRP